MTTLTPERFGRTKTLIATGITVGLLFVLLFLIQTRGDFANGLLFFTNALLNIHILVVLAIVFGLTYLFGGMAGKEIILEKKHFAWTATKFAVLIILAVLSYAAIVGIVKDGNWSPENFVNLIVKYLLIPLSRAGFLSLIPMLIIWLWSTNQMRLLNSQEK